MPRPLPAIAHGGDYNPEQWSPEVWREDVELMGRAGVDLVTLGVFSWALLEPRPGEHDFGWLDEVMGLLGEAGIAVDLATATASPPPWLTREHPEVLPVTADGVRLSPGGRQAFCPSSPVYRELSLGLARTMAERYAGHDALALWHVGNELGGHNARCYCDQSAAAFRTWLAERYEGDVERLNHAWGTAFWSQHYADFEEVLPPRAAPTFPNPTQQLDFARFSSDQLLANFVAERDLLHELSPGVPVTTNFMVMKGVRDMDYWSWAREVDVVSNDHYPDASDPAARRELAFCSDLVRGLAGGGPWLLMEQSPSAVNWQPRNVAKRPGELLRNSLQHVGRGADAVLHFQWRASKAGAEKFHAGLVPHAGTETRLFREVVQQGEVLDAISEVAGSRTVNDVALLFDWQSWWACELDSHPSVDVTYLDRAHALHRSVTEAGVGIDVVGPDSDLSSYRVVLVPTLYLVTEATAERIAAAARAGAAVVVTYFSGIVDEHDHIRLGGYPGAFRDLLGVRVEEFTPLRKDDVVHLDDGSTADVWTEDLQLAGAEALASYVDGPVPGAPAVTRHEAGQGSAWYVATRLEQAATDRLVARVLAEQGVRPVVGDLGEERDPDVELLRRTGADGQSWVFALHHGTEEAQVPLGGFDLVTQGTVDGTLVLAPGAVAVVRET